MPSRFTPAQLQAEVDELGSVSAVARRHGINPRTLRDHAAKTGVAGKHARGATTPGTSASDAAGGGTGGADDFLTVTLPAHPKRHGLRTPDQVLTDHGLDPAEWDVASLADNYWQGSDGEGPANLTQSKVVAKRRVPSAMVLPARTDAPLRTVRPARRASLTRPILIALAADQHCPHQDPELEACWLAWLEQNKPDKIIGMGDIVNLSKPSRHRANLHAKHNDDPGECFQAAHDWWRRSLDAAGDQCAAEQLAGNHDLRCQIACMERLPELYDVKRPGEQHPWWDLEYLMGLDKLGVTYHRPEGEYHSVELPIARGFSGAHGAKSGPYGGAAKDAPRHEGSRATGHAHKASITSVVRYRDGEPHTHVNVSVPTMARLDMGYHPDPDTHQGWATLTVHEDGYWNPELARYDSRRQRLVWRDQSYRPS